MEGDGWHSSRCRSEVSANPSLLPVNPFSQKYRTSPLAALASPHPDKKSSFLNLGRPRVNAWIRRYTSWTSSTLETSLRGQHWSSTRHKLSLLTSLGAGRSLLGICSSLAQHQRNDEIIVNCIDFFACSGFWQVKSNTTSEARWAISNSHITWQTSVQSAPQKTINILPQITLPHAFDQAPIMNEQSWMTMDI